MKEEDLISLIDDVLRDDDKNNDGYIDYAEFAKSLEWETWSSSCNLVQCDSLLSFDCVFCRFGPA